MVISKHEETFILSQMQGGGFLSLYRSLPREEEELVGGWGCSCRPHHQVIPYTCIQNISVRIGSQERMSPPSAVKINWLKGV